MPFICSLSLSPSCQWLVTQEEALIKQALEEQLDSCLSSLHSAITAACSPPIAHVNALVASNVAACFQDFVSVNARYPAARDHSFRFVFVQLLLLAAQSCVSFFFDSLRANTEALPHLVDSTLLVVEVW